MRQLVDIEAALATIARLAARSRGPTTPLKDEYEALSLGCGAIIIQLVS